MEPKAGKPNAGHPHAPAVAVPRPARCHAAPLWYHDPQAERPAGPSAADRPAGPREGFDPARVRVNCFTPGTRIMTPRGETPVEWLKPGDMVITRDNGPQEIRWAGRKRLEGATLRLDTRLHPVLIRAGALGPDMPSRDLRLSPAHRVLLLGDHPALDQAEAEVLVSARHLIGTRGIAQVAADAVDYLHFMCDRHEVVLSDGAWTESFRPGADTLAGMDDQGREEILDLFPELHDLTRPGPMQPARPAADGGVRR